MALEFEWDNEKEVANEKNHGIGFGPASLVFFDPFRSECYDGREAYGEDRFVIVGLAVTVVMVVACTIRRGDVIRIFSARKANRNEQIEYWKNRPTDN